MINPISHTDIDLSVVVPTYNEEGNIAPFLLELCESLDLLLPQRYRVLVVDDNSPDSTLEQAGNVAEMHSQIRLVKRMEKRELSTAVIRGWQMAHGRVLATINADYQHPPHLIAEMWKRIEDTDLVVASRYCHGGSVGDWPLSRRIISRGAYWLGKIMLPDIFMRLTDPLSGCFMLKREVVTGVELKPIGYKSLIEVLARGNVSSIADIPYQMQVRTRGSSKFYGARWGDYLLQLWRLRRALRRAK